MKACCLIAPLSLTAVLALAAPAHAQAGWGTIKGQVVFNGAVPERKPLKVEGPDTAFCLSKGPVLSEEFVVDKETKGVRWAMVWLVDEKGGNKIPIHPKLAKAPEKVEIDQPCCAFEPHVFGMRTGQVLVAKNSAMVSHSTFIIGGDENPNKNVTIPAGKSLDIDGWKASPRPIPIQCTIHKWMNAWVRVFDHPYFAVTNDKGEFVIKDAPAGKYRLVVWHEGVGWVVNENGKSGKLGIPIEIMADKTTDLGALKLTPAKE
jgi:hypothetical protein